MYKVIDAKLENTIFEAREENGEILSYRIRPADGYKLHEVTLDEEIMNEETLEPTGRIKLGYTNSYVTVGANYDFDKNDRQIYAKSDTEEDEVVDIDSVDSETEEKAKAYDILMGADE